MNPDSGSDKRRPRDGRSARLVAAARVGLVALLACATVWSAWVVVSLTSRPENEASGSRELREALTPEGGSKPVTYLLVGVDAASPSKGPRSDTLMLVQLDTGTRRLWMVSIPRDTRVQVAGHGFVKINAARALGGAPLSIRTVEEFLGVAVNHYAEVDWGGFQRLVDDLGGVWIDVPETVDDRKAATHSVDPRTAHIDAGYQLLDGAHALTFVRTRQSLDADFSRMRYQQAMLQALIRRAATPSNAIRAPWFIGRSSRYIVTDMTPLAVLAAVARIVTVSGKGVQTATVVGDWRSPFVWPDPGARQAISEALRLGRDFDARASGFSVTVADGSGVPGAAKAVVAKLKELGFHVERLGVAPSLVSQTAVVYEAANANRTDAERAAKALGGVATIDGRDHYKFTTELLVVIGGDWDTRSP